MKKLLLILLCLPMIGFGQDLLLFQDGNKKDARILEITPEFVKYKRYNSYSEVVYTEDKYNLIGVIFEDGEFEKFESSKSNDSKKSHSNINIGDYGSNMFSVGPLDLFYGLMLNISYEHYTKSGISSIRIPLRIVLGGSYSSLGNGNTIYDFWKIGFEHKFFPTGSNGVVRGFMGYGVHYGSYGYNHYNYNYNDYYYNIEYSEYYNVQFMGGIQIHPSELINITLDVGIGPSAEEYNDYAMSLWPSFSTTIGFRF